jgi:hypothetical protein
MTKVAEIKADKRFPAFITNHAIFNSGREVKKIFPEIGLENFSENVFIENSSEIMSAAQDVVTFIHSEVENRISSLTRYAELKTAPPAGTDVKVFGANRRVKYKKCSFVLKRFKTLLTKSFKTFIILNEKTNKITLNVPEDITDDEKKVLFKRGEGLFKVYQKISELLREAHFLPLGSLDQSPAFKKYNNVNIPGNESKIVFSSTGLDGAWDIATMSMRGIHSCQTWGQGNSTHLVGSIVDPCTAIMYLTSGSKHEDKGTKMMRRSIVRFLIDENNKPSLIIERMYPAHNKDVASKFISLLKKKTGNKFPIINCSLSFRGGTAKTYIPMTPVLAALETTAQPYRDSGIEFKTLVSNRALFLENVRKQIEVIPANYAYKARMAASKVRLSDLTSEADKTYWRFYRAGDAPIYSIMTEAAFILRAKIDEALKNVKDTNVKLPVITLQVFDSMFTNTSAELIATSVIDQFVKHSKRKPPTVFKDKMIENIKNALHKEIEKDRIKLLSKVEKIKGEKTLPLPSDDVIRLIEKVS